ncbi:MAG: sortase [bacterium]|nr:sortase [bacterium]
MGGIVDVAVRLVQAGRRAYAKKWRFLGLFVVAFFGSVVVLGQLDLLPSTKSDLVLDVPADTSQSVASVSTPAVVESPVKIEVPKIDLSAAVANPTTTDVAVLDGGLLKGAVHYPTSAKLGEMGNVVLFGHSSYLPVVGNQAYKTFNGIQKLKAGDTVTVYSSATAYTYTVRSVEKESADNNAAIPLSLDGKVLTLVTCNSFATKQDRFVVTADFVESHLISN